MFACRTLTIAGHPYPRSQSDDINNICYWVNHWFCLISLITPTRSTLKVILQARKFNFSFRKTECKFICLTCKLGSAHKLPPGKWKWGRVPRKGRNILFTAAMCVILIESERKRNCWTLLFIRKQLDTKIVKQCFH